MRRFFPAAIAALIAALPVLALDAQDQSPALAFESHAKDFGKVTQGIPLKHVFKFANKGAVVLEIYKVEGS